MSTTYRDLRCAIDELVRAEDAITVARQKHADAQVKVGGALRRARKQKKLSLRQCAAQLKVSAAYLYDVERGRRGMTDGNLEVLMGIVGPPTMQDVFDALTAAKKAPIIDTGIRIKSPLNLWQETPTAREGEKK